MATAVPGVLEDLQSPIPLHHLESAIKSKASSFPMVVETLSYKFEKFMKYEEEFSHLGEID